MMSREQMAQHPEVDWNVYKNQQSVPKSHQIQSGNSTDEEIGKYHKDIEFGKKNSQPAPMGSSSGINSLYPPLDKNNPLKMLNDPKLVTEMINSFGGEGIANVGKAAGKGIGKGVEKVGEYFNKPAKEAEAFRSELGQGTSKENIAELGKRIEFSKKSAKEEALIPKNELYSQEGKSNVYKVGKESLPEGNLPKMADMVSPGEKFDKNQIKALSNALRYFRSGKVDKTIGGNPTDIFLHKAEDIFNVPELPKSATSKIEDALSMPTKRESAYFGDKEVAEFYGKRGLKTLHDKYEQKPILENYDKLQSAIKERLRSLTKKSKKGAAVDEEIESLKSNVKNLNEDKQNFMITLPEKMQNLENEFREKYRIGVGKYEDAALTIRKLAEGKSHELTSDQISSAFTKLGDKGKQILKDIGPSGVKNVLYDALQKVNPGDAKEMAETILDLKRTKGFDNFISADMEKFAHKIIKDISFREKLKGALKGTGGAGLGFMIGGIPGAIGGAALSHSPQLLKHLKSALSK